MQVVVDESLNARLDEPGDLKTFSVRIAAPLSVLEAASHELRMVEMDTAEYVWVALDWISAERRRQGFVAASDDAELGGMVEYARSKGWVRDHPTRIRGHLV